MEPRNDHPLPTALVIGAVFVYGLLNLVGIWSNGPAWSIAALLLILGLLLWPFLHRGRAGAWLLWLAVASLFGWALWGDRAAIWLDAIPILVNAALAWMFARTLGAGHEPLITRLVRLLEGRQRLGLAGIRSYTRNLTRAWAILLALQALVLAAMWWHWNASTWVGAADMVAPASQWTHAYARFGCYLVIGAFFVLEYGFRRWRLRHLPHANLRTMVSRVVCIWPELLRGTRA